jgi:hypothetical protein
MHHIICSDATDNPILRQEDPEFLPHSCHDFTSLVAIYNM